MIPCHKKTGQYMSWWKFVRTAVHGDEKVNNSINGLNGFKWSP